MKIEKKHIIAVGLGVICTAAGLAYWQYKKITNYCIGLNRIKPNKINAQIADFDLFLNFKNNSSVKIDILSQEYNVFVNNKFITKASNPNKQSIEPESMNIIGVNIKFNPTVAGQNLLDALLKMGNTVIKVDIKLKVKVWLFTISIPYIYQTSLKELMIPSTEPKKDVKCK